MKEFSRKRRVFAIALIGGILLIGAQLSAQRVKSSLSGMVADPSGAAVHGASVLLTNEKTGISSTFQTGRDGTFNFPFLDPGTYSLKGEAAGFKMSVRTGIIVRVATDERADLPLQLGQVAEQVNVEGTAPLLETVSSMLGQTVASKTINDLPLNGRNIFSLLNILPGSSLGGPNGAGFTASNPVIDGQGPRGNNFTLDGVSINQEHSGFSGGAGVAYTPNIDAISEFKVVTNDYSAEYGRSLSAVISLSIKSGTNTFHGTAYEFLGNDVLNARNYYSSATAAKPVLRYNQFGFSVGGPIIKNKLFFFTNAEWLRNIGQAVNISTVPTAAMRAGDFSGDTNTIYDPDTTVVGPGGEITRAPFAGNIIPANRIDPIAQALTAFWPEPNLPGDVANYRLVSNTSTKQVRTDTRIDYNLRSSDTISGRFSYSNPTILGAARIAGPANPGATAYQHTTTPQFQISETHVFSPRLVNEFRVGYQKERFVAQGDPEASQDWRTQLGMPLLFGDPAFQQGFPYTAPSGITTIGTPFDFFLFTTQVLQFNDTLSWNKGKHNLKIGGSFSKIHSDDRIPNFPAGGYFFFGDQTSLPGVENTGRGYADFLLGRSSLAYAGFLFGGGLSLRYNEAAAFIQDDYRITPKLTLNLGLRYDLATVAHTNEGTIWNYDPSINTMVEDDPPVPSDKTNFGPRVGFTYLVHPSTVLRGGYGISYLPQFKGLGGFMVNPPVLQQHAFFTDGVTPARTLNQDFGVFETGSLSELPVTPDLSVEQFLDDQSKSPYVQSWNLTLQHSLASNIVLTASYVGNMGTHIGVDTSNVNQLPADQLGPDSDFGGVPAQERRRYPGAGGVQAITNDLSTNYHALQAKLEFRAWHGLSGLTSYTHGKTLGVESYSYIQEAHNKSGSYGLASADLPNTFIQSFNYELPFGRGHRWIQGGVLDQIVGGWQFNGILTLRDGYPINLTAADLSNSFSNNGVFRPDILCDATLSGSERTLDHWFNPDCYAQPQPYTFGNAPVFSIRGPGMFNLDLSAFKRFSFTESKQLEFRAETFNLTNTPGFGNPDGTIGTPSAGVISSLINPNRKIQFGLKFLF
jgi:hypothetical protein